MGMTNDPMLLVAAFLAVIWAFLVALARPRLCVYVIFALTPTQFLFVPVSDFFLSPADGLVLLAGAAFIVRRAAGSRGAVDATRHHRYLILVGCIALIGLLVQGVWVRTIVRFGLALVPSLLAVEALRTRVHLRRATVALILSAVIEIVYGLVVYYRPGAANPGRFTGMSGGWTGANFVATTVLTATAILLARRAKARNASKLVAPGILALFGFATLSKMGPLAFLAAWWTVLRSLVTNVNKQRLAIAALAITMVLLAQAPVRDALWLRVAREARGDGEVVVNSTDIRLMILDLAFRAFTESPLIGIGFSRFMPYSAGVIDIPLSSAFEAATHNTYLGVMVETGILGLLAFLLHFVQYLKRIPILLRKIVRDHDVTAGAAMAGMPVVLVSAALNDLLLIYHFWAVCGLALACVNLLVDESSQTPSASRTGIVTFPRRSDWR
jgi:hypothetical protein